MLSAARSSLTALHYENMVTDVVDLGAPCNANCFRDGRRTREANEDYLILQYIPEIPTIDDNLDEEPEEDVPLILRDIEEYRLCHGLDDDGWEQSKKAKRAVEKRESEQDDRFGSLRRLPEAKPRQRL